mmetsp:Transcript_9387/g.29670  ORF Transcript_9387/g.29670 Transcript_9387/m.29670 type:complete len:277 (+) Transcript_9387:50-880(+)
MQKPMTLVARCEYERVERARDDASRYISLADAIVPRATGLKRGRGRPSHQRGDEPPQPREATHQRRVRLGHLLGRRLRRRQPRVLVQQALRLAERGHRGLLLPRRECAAAQARRDGVAHRSEQLRRQQRRRVQKQVEVGGRVAERYAALRLPGEEGAEVELAHVGTAAGLREGAAQRRGVRPPRVEDANRKVGCVEGSYAGAAFHAEGLSLFGGERHLPCRRSGDESVARAELLAERRRLVHLRGDQPVDRLTLVHGPEEQADEAGRRLSLHGQLA